MDFSFLRAPGIRGRKASPKAMPLVAYMGSQELGSGDCSVTGEYMSGKNAFNAKVVYRQDADTRLYGTYSVSDEKIGVVGIETHVSPAKDLKALVDLHYQPAKDAIGTKLVYKHNNYTLKAALSCADVRAKKLGDHSEVLELKRKMGGRNDAHLTYAVQSGVTKMRLDHKLDEDNTLKMTFHYVNQEKKHVEAELHHTLNSRNQLVIGANWGSKAYGVEWKNSVEDGKWSVKYGFPFAASPKDGQLTIKRRVDF